MKMYKKVIIVIVVIAIIVAGCGTGIYFYKRNTKTSHLVEVASFDNISMFDDMEMNNSTYGIVYSGGGQNIFLNDGDIVSQFLVNEGDEVQAGTPVIQLDSEKLKLELDSCLLTVSQDDLDIGVAQGMLEKYKKAVPYVEEPETEEPDTEEEPVQHESISPDNILSEINNISQAFSGSGTADDPYQFKCTGDCMIDGKLFKSIEKNGTYCKLYIFSEEFYSFAYVCDLSPSGKNIFVRKDTKWSVGTIYTLADGTETIQLNPELPPVPCEFSTYVDESLFDDSDDEDDIDDEQEDLIDDEDNPESADGIDGAYTQEELNKMIFEKQQEISKLQLQKREDELAVKQAQSKYNKATITSTVNGVVTSINTNAISGEPAMVISDGTGLYVKTAIDEFSFSDFEVGDKLTVTTWGENGSQQIEASITSISPYPTTDSSFSYSSHSNVSYYPVVAAFDKDVKLSADEYVDISFETNNDDDEDVLAIDKAYVGSDEKGSFLYLTDEDYILHKTYVKTGKTLYDWYIQILDDIDTDSYIASPYTKYAAEGAMADIDSVE